MILLVLLLDMCSSCFGVPELGEQYVWEHAQRPQDVSITEC